MLDSKFYLDALFFLGQVASLAGLVYGASQCFAVKESAYPYAPRTRHGALKGLVNLLARLSPRPA